MELQKHGPPPQFNVGTENQLEWQRTLCENKAVAIMQQMQEGKPALIPKECEEILIAIVLDQPLVEAKNLVENPEGFFDDILDTLSKKRNHPVLMQMFQDMATPGSATSERATSSTNQPSSNQATPPEQFQ